MDGERRSRDERKLARKLGNMDRKDRMEQRVFGSDGQRKLTELRDRRALRKTERNSK